MITINQQPGARIFSRNPIIYKISTNTPLDTTGLYLLCRVFFNGALLAELPLQPDTAGNASIDIKTVIDASLFFSRPALTTAVELVTQQSGTCHAEFHELTTAAPVDPDFRTSIVSLVFKGGLASHVALESSAFFTWSNSFKRYLTWHANGRVVAPWQQHWITYLHLANTKPAGIAVQAEVGYSDGYVLTSAVLLSFPSNSAQHDKLYRFPAGFDALGLETLDASKIAVWYSVRIVDTSDANALLVQAFRFDLDYTPDYEKVILHYHGPLGAFEAVRLRGEHDETISRAQEAVELYTNGVPTASGMTPQDGITAHSLQRTFKSNFSYTDSLPQQELRTELFNTDPVQRLVNGRWWPVVINNKNIDKGRLSSQIRTLEVEWQYALREVNFSPEATQILPGSGGATCPLVTGLTLINVGQDQYQVTWNAMPEHLSWNIRLVRTDSSETVINNNSTSFLQIDATAEPLMDGGTVYVSANCAGEQSAEVSILINF